MAQVTIQATKDASVVSGRPDYNINNNYLYIGHDNDTGDENCRSLVYFDLSALAGREIISASLKMYQTNSGFATALNFSANCISADFTESAVTWNNQPAHSATAAVNLQASADVVSDTLRTYDISTLIQDIIHNSRMYYGLLFKQTDATEGTLKMFCSSEESGKVPELTVVYGGIMSAKVSSAWESADAYAKVGGVWKLCKAYAKVGGVWELGI